jgi:hypothetical protein
MPWARKGGISCAALAPALRHPRAEDVVGDPDQLGVGGSEVVGDAPPDPLRVGRDVAVFVGLEHEGEALVVGADADDRDRLRRVADLAEGRHAVEPRRAEEVADQPVLFEAVAVEADPERRPHEAGAAVGADHEARPYRRRVAVGAAPAHLDRLAVRPQRIDRDPLVDLDLRQRAAEAVEHVLDVRLVHHVELRPAAGGGVVVGDLDQGLAVAVHPLVVALDDRPGEHLLAHPELLEGAHDLVVEAGRPRQVVKARVALQHDDAVAGAAEQRRQRHPGRPVADDRHVVRRLSHRHTPYEDSTVSSVWPSWPPFWIRVWASAACSSGSSASDPAGRRKPASTSSQRRARSARVVVRTPSREMLLT